MRATLRNKVDTSLVIIIATAVLHNIARNHNLPDPDDMEEANLENHDQPAPILIDNQQGAAIRRTLVLNHFT